jgi:hypothetical protein
MDLGPRRATLLLFAIAFAFNVPVHASEPASQISVCDGYVPHSQVAIGPTYVECRTRTGPGSELHFEGGTPPWATFSATSATPSAISSAVRRSP